MLLNLLKSGKLLNPYYKGTTSTSSPSGSSGTVTSGANGYERGYKGGQYGNGKIYAQGLDVSYWQLNNINFSKIKAAGYDYVILRCGTTKGKDACFESFYSQAKAVGLDVGVYYYTYATTVAGAKTDAQNTLNWIKGKKFEYPIYFDYEDACQNGLSQTTAKNICLTYMDMIADAGYLTGMYTGYYKSTQIPLSSICSKYEFWVAHYYNNTYTALGTKYSTYSGMYQYSCEKYVGGMGPYDANVCYKDYPAIVKKYGFNGYTATTSSGSNSGSTSGSTTTTTVDMPTKLATLDNSFTANIKFAKATSMCLGVNGTNVALYTYTTTSAKQWKFEKQSDGSYKITNVKTGKCLAVAGNSADADKNVQVATSDNSNGQRWFIYNVNGSYVFKPACSAKTVLDIYNSTTEEGTNAQTYTYNAGAAQMFKIVKTPVIPTTAVNLGSSFTAKINFVKANKNLSIYNKSEIIIYKNTDSTAQQWKFTKQSDGSYEINNIQYNKLLSVKNNASTEGTLLVLAADKNANGQRWFIHEVGGGYILRPACSTTAVIDIINSGTEDCTRAQIWTYNTAAAQKFEIVKSAEIPTTLANLGESFTAKITNTKSKRNLFVSVPSNDAIIFQNTDSKVQLWKFDRQTDGSYKITNVRYDMCLGVVGNSTTTAGVKIAEESTAAGQRWFIYEVDGKYVFNPACSENTVLTVKNGSSANSTRMQTLTYKADSSQTFSIIKTSEIPTNVANLGESFTATVNNVNSKKNLSVSVPSNDAIIFEVTTNKVQQWKFDRQSDGSYKITNVRYNMCLGVVGNSASSAGVKIAEESTAAGQRWFIYEIDGKYIFSPACSEITVLAVKNSSIVNSTRMCTIAYNADPAQFFDIVKISN